jgi:predicted Zn-dependent protease
VFKELEQRFRKIVPAVDYCSLRLVHTYDEILTVRRDLVQPVRRQEDVGAMITVFDAGGLGYAATPELSSSGLKRAISKACQWARAAAPYSLIAAQHLDWEVQRGEYRTPVSTQPWSGLTLAEKLDLLRRACARLKIDEAIVEWQAGLWHRKVDTLHMSSDGGHIAQHFEALLPSLQATAHRSGETQIRSFGRGAHLRQGGLEILEDTGFNEAAPAIAQQALELLHAPNCPSGVMDLLLAPDQMILQIHESIGHPLELDRILGDERNYAGTSFVTLDMFGTYRYGSQLLNVTFDPGLPQQIASYGYDDDGQPARRQYLIKEGILLHPLGGKISQARSGQGGVANARASSWNRPPIDRMANLNLEPGSSDFADLVKSVERGIYMATNCSWSIDDSRNKFQFGCEWGQMIENGELTEVVRNPNYRGISADFWRSLAGVGDSASFQVLGVAACGKGEPNQLIAVGHAAPPCLFRNVAVFGGG